MATPINATGLNAPNPLSTVTPQPDPLTQTGSNGVTVGQNIINDAIASVPGLQSTVDTANANTQTNLNTLASLQTQDSNKAIDTAAAYDAAGVNTEKANFDKYNQDLNDINANLSGLANEAKAIPLDVQNKAANTGATDAGLAPITTGRLRDNAIKALTQSSLADVLTANINNSKIRYQAAKDKADQAVNLKYAPIEAQIANLKEQLQLNKEYITDPAEKKLADAQEKILTERTRVIAENKQNEKDVNDVVLNAINQGAPPEVVANIKKATNQSQAVQYAGKYAGSLMQNELLRAQIDQQKATTAKTKADTAKTQAETASTLSAAQQTQVDSWVKNIQNKSATLANVPAALKNAVSVALSNTNAGPNVGVVQNLNDTVYKIQTVLDSGYLSGAVGPNTFARLSPLSSFTGGQQDFLAGVSQITNQETLDKLLQLKASGGTLGALNESEGKMLRDAATKINGWAIKDKDGNVTGYNTSEAAFRKELTTLQDQARRAIVNAGGEVIPTNNAFTQALGGINKPIPGTTILNSISGDGSLDFSIPGFSSTPATTTKKK